MSAATAKWWRRAYQRATFEALSDIADRHLSDQPVVGKAGDPLGEVVYEPPRPGHTCKWGFPRDARLGTIWRCGTCSQAWQKASEWGWKPLTEGQVRRALRRAGRKA